MTMRWQASVAVLCALVVGASACSKDESPAVAPVAAADSSVDPEIYASQPNLFGNPYTAPTPAPSGSANPSVSPSVSAKPSKSATPSKSAAATPSKSPGAPKPSQTTTKPVETVKLPSCSQVKTGFEGDLQEVKVVASSTGETLVKCTLNGLFLGQAVEVKVTFGVFTSTSALTSLARSGCNGSAKKVSTGYKYSTGCDNTSGAAKSGLAVSDGKLFAATTSTLKSDLAVNADIRKITADNNKRAAPTLMAELQKL